MDNQTNSFAMGTVKLVMENEHFGIVKKAAAAVSVHAHSCWCECVRFVLRNHQ